MKALWQPCLMDIPTTILEILVDHTTCWLDSRLHQSLFPPSFGGSIFMYVLLAFLLCKQKQLLHVLMQNVGSFLKSKVA
jgi:hypothetical protein